MGGAAARGRARSRRRARNRRLHRPAAQRRRPAEGRKLGGGHPLDARAAVHPARRDLRHARTRESPDVEGDRSADRADHRLPHLRHLRPPRTIWLDGRPHPLGIRAPHLGRLLHRHVGRQQAHGDDDAHQDGMDSAQRRRDQRPGDDDRALHPARRHHDGRLDRQRSGVSLGAVHPHLELGPRLEPAAQLVRRLRTGGRRGRGSARIRVRIICRGATIRSRPS